MKYLRILIYDRQIRTEEENFVTKRRPLGGDQRWSVVYSFFSGGGEVKPI